MVHSRRWRTKGGGALAILVAVVLALPALVAATSSSVTATDEYCRAVGLRLGAEELSTANEAGNPCKSEEARLRAAAIDGLQAEAVIAETNTGPASAEAALLAVELGELLEAEVVTAWAEAGCDNGDFVLQGHSEVAGLKVHGTDVEAGVAHLHVPLLPLGMLHINHQETDDNRLTQRALWLEGSSELVIAEAIAGVGSCDAPPPPPPPPPPVVCPDADVPAPAHPDDCTFAPPAGQGEDFVNFGRHIPDSDTTSTDGDSRENFNGKAGFIDGDTLEIKGDFYDDDDMHFRLRPQQIAAYLAPDGDPNSRWRRFCGFGVVEQFNNQGQGGDDDHPPVAPFVVGQIRPFLVEVFDKELHGDSSGGNNDYWVIDIYEPVTQGSPSKLDTEACDPKGPGQGSDHEGVDGLAYHAEGRIISGNIHVVSERTTR